MSQSTQLAFGDAPAQSHSPTSVAAAKAIKPKVSGLRRRVLEFLANAGPATDEDMQIRMAMSPNTQRPRRVELVRDGLVAQFDTGQTRAGRAAVLWCVSDEGWAFLDAERGAACEAL